MPDNLIIINKSTGKVVATHRIEQNITLEKHYPSEQYGECEIVVLPESMRVNVDTLEDPREKMDEYNKHECSILTKAREIELSNKIDFKALAKLDIEKI
jgi:hypothetical protein